MGAVDVTRYRHDYRTEEAVTGGIMLAVRVGLAFILLLAAAAPAHADATDDLLAAAKGGTASEVKAAIAAGADLNARDDDVRIIAGVRTGDRGLTPLHWAAKYNPEPSVIEALMEGGADIDARSEKYGTTPLHSAAVNPAPSVVAALIAAGADVNARTESGATPLHWAAWENPEPLVVEALIEAGANPNARNRGGNTPLHAAAVSNPAPSVVEALIEAGADPSARTESGKTPFDYAEENPALRGTDVYWRLNEARFK